MAIVFFSSELQRFTGEKQTRVEAVIFKEIVAELTNRYEKLVADQLMEMAISVDDEIIHNPLLERVGENSELHFLHRIAAG